MTSVAGLAGNRERPLKPFLDFAEEHTPLWIRLGFLRRKRGRLGLSLLKDKIEEKPLEALLLKVADNQIKIDETIETLQEKLEAKYDHKRSKKSPLSENTQDITAAPAVKPEGKKEKKARKKREKALSRAFGNAVHMSTLAYILPTLGAGLATASVQPVAGFAMQAADMAALDVGQSVLDSLKDNKIDLKKPDMIYRALKEPLLMADIHRQVRVTLAVEAAIIGASFALGSAITQGEKMVAAMVPPEKLSENLAYNVLRFVPNAPQGAVQKGTQEAAQMITMGMRSAFSSLAGRSIDFTGEAVKFSARTMQKLAVSKALQVLTPKTEAIFRAVYGNALAQTIIETRRSKGFLKEDPALNEKVAEAPSPHRIDANGRIYFNPSAWTGINYN
jgi:hypothetical protein